VGDGRPVRVDYALTERGEALAPVIEEMVDWGEEYLRDADSPAESVAQTALPGQKVYASMTSSTCSSPMV
jgi:DNA-binding HxlR family transcriptional regulator